MPRHQKEVTHDRGTKAQGQFKKHPLLKGIEKLHFEHTGRQKSETGIMRCGQQPQDPLLYVPRTVGDGLGPHQYQGEYDGGYKSTKTNLTWDPSSRSMPRSEFLEVTGGGNQRFKFMLSLTV